MITCKEQQTTAARCVLTEIIQQHSSWWMRAGGARVELGWSSSPEERKMIQGAVSCKQHVRTDDDTDRRLHVLKSSETRSFIYVWLYINLWPMMHLCTHITAAYESMFSLIWPESVWTDCVISVFKCKDQVCGDKPGNALHFTGTKLQLIHNKVSQSATRGRQTLHWGSCTPTQTQRDHWRLLDGPRPITRRIFPPGCSRTRRGQTWSPDPSRTCSGTRPWKKQREVWLNIHTSMLKPF